MHGSWAFRPSCKPDAGCRRPSAPRPRAVRTTVEGLDSHAAGALQNGIESNAPKSDRGVGRLLRATLEWTTTGVLFDGQGCRNLLIWSYSCPSSDGLMMTKSPETEHDPCLSWVILYRCIRHQCYIRSGKVSKRRCRQGDKLEQLERSNARSLDCSLCTLSRLADQFVAKAG